MIDLKTVQVAALRSVVIVASCARASAHPSTGRILSHHPRTCVGATSNDGIAWLQLLWSSSGEKYHFFLPFNKACQKLEEEESTCSPHLLFRGPMNKLGCPL